MEWTEQNGAKALEKMYLRASCRSFADKEISEEVLRKVIDAGLCAASGGNLQPVSIIIITGEESKKQLCEACGNQKFISQAPVNLLFLLDWHKLSIYAKNQDAPFTCNDSFMPFLIGLEDVMCTAQAIETAAHFMGIGSCYVGTTNHCADKLADMYNLPQFTYPVVMLSLGYPATEPEVRKKLSYDIMVFKDKYPDLSDEFICNKYDEKYGDTNMRFPSAEPYRSELLQRYKAALLTTFSSEKTEELLKTAEETGVINEIQRRFGLHYNAKEHRDLGVKVIEMFKKQGLTPFHTSENRTI